MQMWAPSEFSNTTTQIKIRIIQKSRKVCRNIHNTGPNQMNKETPPTKKVAVSPLHK